MVFDFSNKELFNEIYIDFLHNLQRYNIAYGGRDSGKSDGIVEIIVIKMLESGFFRLVLTRKHYVQIKNSQFQTIVDYIKLWNLEKFFHITYSPLQIVCKLNGNMILARGLDSNEESTKSMKDITAIWYEEADEISLDAFLETTLTVRSSRTNKYYEFITFNPQREKCWINDYFFPPKQEYEKEDGLFHWVKSTKDNTQILHTTYKDNRFCTPERRALLESLKNQDENHYKVKTLGLWGGALKGLIYDKYKIHYSTPSGADIVYGMDCGFKNPTTLIEVAYYEGTIYLKELLYVTDKNPDDIAKILSEEFATIIGNNQIICDSANPGHIQAIASKGFNIAPAIKGQGSVYNGIMEVKSYQISINGNSANLLREFNSYVWKKTNSNQPTDEPVKIDDHTPDAVRYAVQTYGAAVWKQETNNDNQDNIIRSVPRVRRVRERHY